MQYLLDTDICIYWLKNRQSVRDKLLEIGFTQVAISVITVSELYFGAYNSSKIEQHLVTAETFINNMTVLSLTNHALKQFGQLKAKLRQVGLPVADFDLLIASLAMTEELTLVTNNIRHYERIPNLILENWV